MTAADLATATRSWLTGDEPKTPSARRDEIVRTCDRPSGEPGEAMSTVTG